MRVGWFERGRRRRRGRTTKAWSLIVFDDCDALRRRPAAGRVRAVRRGDDARRAGRRGRPRAAGRPAAARRPAHPPRLGPCVRAAAADAKPEARAALRREADRRGIFLSDDVMDYLLTRFARDLKHLMALLDRLDEFALAEQARDHRAAAQADARREAQRERDAVNLCLFDLDDTLLPIDSDHAWGEFLVRLGWVDAAEFRAPQRRVLRAVQGRPLDIHAYIEFATEPLRAPHAGRSGRRARALHARGDRAGAAARRRSRWCARTSARGDLVALVTATNDFVTAPIAQAFGVDDLIAVRLERGPGGTITGRIDGTPSYREGKVKRVDEWLARARRRLGRLRAHQRLQRLDQRPAAARACHRPGGDQPVAGARGDRARARLAHPETLRMIKKFIDKLLGKTAAGARAGQGRGAGKRVEVPKSRARHRPGAGRRARRQGRQHAGRGAASRPTSSAARCATCWSACGRRTSTSRPTRRPSR